MAKTASQLFLVRLSRRTSEVIIILGVLVLVGWLFNVPVLKSDAPHLIAMDPLTAGLFILIGIALIRTNEAKASDPFAILCAVVTTIGGAMKILECVSRLDFHFGEPLFRGKL